MRSRTTIPYGLELPGRTTQVPVPTKEGFTGHETDAATGLVYAGARYYMPAVPRWTSVDPLADEFPAYSPYNYVMGNPLSLVDPDGMAPQDDYYIDTDAGTITKVETNDDFDRFYDNSGDKPELIAQLDKNDAGLVQFPASGTGFSRYGTVDAGGVDEQADETVGSGDHYLQGEAAASLFAISIELNEAGIEISYGDMSSSNGSDPWQSGFSHHKGHGHKGNRSGLDVDFRYINKDGKSFRSSRATTNSNFSLQNNQTVYTTAQRWGFSKNYQGKSGPAINGPVRVSGHNDHGHLGYTGMTLPGVVVTGN